MIKKNIKMQIKLHIRKFKTNIPFNNLYLFKIKNIDKNNI